MFELLMVKRKASGGLGFGIFAGSEASINLPTEKYEYSSNSIVPSTSIGTNLKQSAGLGNYFFGLFAGGMNAQTPHSAIVKKFQYSDEVVSPTTSLTQSKYSICAAGNSATGIISGGRNNSYMGVVDKYIYSNDTVTSAVAIDTVSRADMLSRGNATFCFLCWRSRYTQRVQ